MILDASNSYDEDINPSLISSSLISSSSSLSYLWSCYQISPTYDNKCGLIIKSALLNTSSLIIHADDTIAMHLINGTLSSVVTVMIQDKNNKQRFSQTSVTINTISASSPVVSVEMISSSSSSSIVNTNTKINIINLFIRI